MGRIPKDMSFERAISEQTRKSQPIFDWLAEGKRAMMFTIEGRDLARGCVFLDKFCYSVDFNISSRPILE